MSHAIHVHAHESCMHMHVVVRVLYSSASSLKRVIRLKIACLGMVLWLFGMLFFNLTSILSSPHNQPFELQLHHEVSA